MNSDKNFEKLIQDLELDFSEIKIGGKYTSIIEHNGLVYISGQIPRVGDVIKVVGKVGTDVDLLQAQFAASISTMRALSLIKTQYGTLDVIDRVLQMNVFVHSSLDFTQQSEVADGASEIFYQVLGLNEGKHTRTSVGVCQLPKNAAVEISFVFAISKD